MQENTTTVQGDSAAASRSGSPLAVVPFGAHRRAPDSRGFGDYDIRLARTAAQHGAVDSLVRRMYAWRGYSIQPSAYLLGDPNRMTLAVWQDKEALATLTIGRDSTEGLLADGLYAGELAGLRHPGRLVCEVTRLAVHPDFSCPDMLNALFYTALLYGKAAYRASDAVIEVNPRHVRFYESRFGFRQVGKLRQCPRVNAPAVLLHQTLDSLKVHGAGLDFLREERTSAPPLAAAS